MSGCGCEADDIMTETKAKKPTSKKGVVANLEKCLSEMIDAVGDAPTENQRNIIIKLDVLIKYATQRWDQ